MENIEDNYDGGKIYISNIGSIRDYNMNKNFIDSLNGSQMIELNFNGESKTNNQIENYVKVKNIQNVITTGRYNREDEKILYQKSNMINILLHNDDINSIALLPNRLYNALFYNKPIITYKGSYTAYLFEKYDVGLVLKSFSEVEDKINKYLKEFKMEKFKKNRKEFFDCVIKDNNYFKSKLNEFIKQKI